MDQGVTEGQLRRLVARFANTEVLAWSDFRTDISNAALLETLRGSELFSIDEGANGTFLRPIHAAVLDYMRGRWPPVN